MLRAVEPRRIVLYGDLDLLGVMPDGMHHRKTGQEVLWSLMGLGLPKGIGGDRDRRLRTR